MLWIICGMYGDLVLIQRVEGNLENFWIAIPVDLNVP